ncbi:CRTAC1 family protein [Hirschia maritima]|uniref:CRTAC1 family protein n=1 Tax=Hirschia maritima TaxID=1121961 RepID=UPI00037672E1|nr:CRTAC1 family protein [Hirschia maritima]
MNKKFVLSMSCLSIIGVISSGCSTSKDNSLAPASAFSITTDVIDFGSELKKKWGAAVISDLDQDGWDDIITTDHTSYSRIFWNNAGNFSAPVVLINGDTHGMGVSDYNGDGKMDIIITLGGGNGGNPRRPIHYTVGKDRQIKKIGLLDHFNSTRGRTIKFLDADHDSDLDLFYTGFAPHNVKQLSTNQFYTNSNGKLSFSATLPVPNDPLSFKVLSTDINNDNYMDVIVHGGRDLTLSLGNADGTFTNTTKEAFGELAKLKFVTNITEIDYDNDGDFDLFLSRAPFQFGREIYFDDKERNLAFFQFNGKITLDDFVIEGDTLELENLQETYATYGVFVGKNRKKISPETQKDLLGKSLIITSEEAQGWPEEDTKGVQIGYLGNNKWRIGGFVKSRIAGVVKNVKSYENTEPRELLPPKLLENRNGKFFDITESLGITISEQIQHATAADFDNDGFVDLALIPYGNMALPIAPRILMNKAGKSFKITENSGLISSEIGATGSSIEAIDFNQDGRLDIVFANERGRWYLAKNQLQKREIGNFIAVKVGNSPEGKAQHIGARVEISSCGKKQSRLVGSSGDGFHHMLKDRLNFGIGACEKIDSVKITWSNGETKSFEDIDANTTISTSN